MASCPIPVELREWRGTVETVEEAADLLERMAVEKTRNAKIRAQIKRLVINGDHVHGIRFGKDKVARLVEVPKTEIRDRDGMFAALEASRLHGTPFDRSRFEVRRVATEFKDVKIEEAGGGVDEGADPGGDAADGAGS